MLCYNPQIMLVKRYRRPSNSRAFVIRAGRYFTRAKNKSGTTALTKIFSSLNKKEVLKIRLAEIDEMKGKKRTRNTPNSSLDSSVTNPRSVRRVTVEDSQTEAENSSVSEVVKGNSGDSNSEANSWSEVSEDILLSDDPSIVDNASPPKAGSTPQETQGGPAIAGSTPASSTRSSFDSLVNGTLISPPENMKQMMERNCGTLEKMNISRGEIKNGKDCGRFALGAENMEVDGSEVTNTNTPCDFLPGTSGTQRKNFFRNSYLEEETSISKLKFNWRKEKQVEVKSDVSIIDLKRKKMNASLKMAIFPSNYPDHVVVPKMREIIMEQVRLTLAAEMEKARNDADNLNTIAFEEERLRSGQLIVVCMNRRSAVWLNMTVKKIVASEDLSQFGLINLKIVPVSQADAKPTFTLWHSNTLISFEEVKKEMKIHQAIETKNWKLLNEATITTGNAGVRFTFLGDASLTQHFDEPRRERRFNHLLMKLPIYVRWQRSEVEEEEGRLLARSLCTTTTNLISFKILKLKHCRPDWKDKRWKMKPAGDKRKLKGRSNKPCGMRTSSGNRAEWKVTVGISERESKEFIRKKNQEKSRVEKKVELRLVLNLMGWGTASDLHELKKSELCTGTQKIKSNVEKKLEKQANRSKCKINLKSKRKIEKEKRRIKLKYKNIVILIHLKTRMEHVCLDSNSVLSNRQYKISQKPAHIAFFGDGRQTGYYGD